MPRIVCISDTHTMHDKVILPDGDILVHAGDFMDFGRNPVEATNFLTWFSSQKHQHKILIAGNHDVYFEQYPDITKRLMPDDVRYLQDSGARIEGLLFWGSPVTPRFFDWAFNRDRGENIAQHWQQIPEGTDVLITHGPPLGVLDRVGNESVGCADLYVRTARIAPKLHVFGHIHVGYGRRQIEQTCFVNASVCNERYRPVNAPHVVDL